MTLHKVSILLFWCPSDNKQSLFPSCPSQLALHASLLTFLGLQALESLLKIHAFQHRKDLMMSNTYKTALLSGDGVGPEVIAEAMDSDTAIAGRIVVIATLLSAVSLSVIIALGS